MNEIKKERPILFSTAMVQAIIRGEKTQTRRIVKESFNGCLTNGGPHPCPNDPIIFHPGEQITSEENPDVITVDTKTVEAHFHCSTLNSVAKCPYGKIGDMLWVRETWTKYHPVDENGYTNFNEHDYFYLADGPTTVVKVDADGFELEDQRDKWKPSIHMPKEAARLFLQIVDIRIESLHDINYYDAIKEGVKIEENDGSKSWYRNYLEDVGALPSPQESFMTLWKSINGTDSWECNPWVWVIEFKKIEK